MTFNKPNNYYILPTNSLGGGLVLACRGFHAPHEQSHPAQHQHLPRHSPGLHAAVEHDREVSGGRVNKGEDSLCCGHDLCGGSEKLIGAQRVGMPPPGRGRRREILV